MWITDCPQKYCVVEKFYDLQCLTQHTISRSLLKQLSLFYTAKFSLTSFMCQILFQSKFVKNSDIHGQKDIYHLEFVQKILGCVEGALCSGTLSINKFFKVLTMEVLYKILHQSFACMNQWLCVELIQYFRNTSTATTVM